MKDRDTIRSVVLDFVNLHKHPDYPTLYAVTWYDALAFCAGYFGEITLDMVMVVRELQREGEIE